MPDSTQPPAGDVEAREAALKEAIDVYNFGATNNAKNFRDPVAFRAAINYAIDRYLAKLTPTKAEPSRIADIAAEEWQNLLDKDDRNSPAEYPDMCLITAKELHGILREHITAIEADRDRMREALETAEAAANVAMKYAEQERKVATVPATMEYQVGHILTAIRSAALTPTNPDREG